MSPRRPTPSPAPTYASLLADDLRGRILSGELPAGMPLREETLASETGRSRHTVRTALALLTAERLAIQEPHRGIRVTSFSAEDAIGLQQLRSALEAEAIRLTRDQHGSDWPDELMNPIRESMTQLEQTVAEHPTDWPVLAAAHAGVHRAVVAASQSPRLIEAYAGLDSEMLLLLVNLRPTYSANELLRVHREYVEAVVSVGESAVRQHLDYGVQQLSPRSSRGRGNQLPRN